MENPSNQTRACIMIVDHKLDYGIALADWLAAQGYQAVFFRSLERAIEEWHHLRPHTVIVGLNGSEPRMTLHLRRLFRVIAATSPHVPIVTMGVRSGGRQVASPGRGPLRHLHVPIKPLEFTYIGQLLRAELNAAAVSPQALSPEKEDAAGQAPGHHVDQHAPYQEVTT